MWSRRVRWQLSPLKRFLLSAVLWLPAMFFVWVYFSSVFSLPATSTVRAVLEHRYDGIFNAVYHGYPRHLFAPDAATPVQPGMPAEGARYRDDHLLALRFNERAMPPQMRDEKRRSGAEPLPTVNSLIYGYGLALIWGLIMATPLSTRRRLLQMAAGWLAIVLVQVFGLATNALVVAMQYLGLDAVAAQGINPELLAASYQFGYLILPAVVPVVLWVLMNRTAIEELTGRSPEPVALTQVESADAEAIEPRPPDPEDRS